MNLSFFILGEAMQEKAFGSWDSPISSDTVIKKSIKFCQTQVENETIYWTEGRPEEKGRIALVCQEPGSPPRDVLDKTYNIRSAVHEYGGKSFSVKNNVVYFVNFEDQQIYKFQNNQVDPITNNDDHRFIDLVISPCNNFLYCVAEKHHNHIVSNFICAINLETRELTTLHQGFDFYMGLTLSPDGKKLAWVCWNQPNMPWDGSQLWLAHIKATTLSQANQIAGSLEEAIVDPSFSKNGDLYFLSDKSGWWNFYIYKNDSIEAICPTAIEFGRPMWIFGESTYSFINWKGSLKIIARGIKKGISCLYMIDIATKQKEPLSLPFTYISNIQTLGDKIIFTASSPKTTSCLVEYSLKNEKYHILKHSQDIELDPGNIAEPIAIAFPTEKGETAYGFYYPPTNKDFKGLKDEKPPVIVKCHGGPTAQVFPTLSMEYLYFTSRGIGIFDINYGGSTGYGRDYRQRLKHQWGIVDVQDCENAAKYLVKNGYADKDRIAIKGGSAGGYTTLAALTFTKTFKVGVSYYGVSDLIALAEESHKFEARYLDQLVAAYPIHKNIYEKRSPIKNLEKLSSPILFLQGGRDFVVPPNQSKMMYEALLKKGLPTAFILFEEEGHGFRSGPNIKTSLESELYFYSKIFNFPIVQKNPKIKIENMKNL